VTSARSIALPVLACLFAALIAVGATIAIPLLWTPVPIVLQNFFIMLAALLLGPRWGLVSTLLYLLLGALGLPVLAGGTGGLAHFFGPSGGYLVGYLPGVLAMGWLARIGTPRWWKHALAASLGMAVVYALGVARLKMVLDVSWTRALVAGVVPFVPGDLVKIAMAVALALRLRPWLEELLDEGAPSV
jgi:biotin transport system substrate-specific component